MSELVSPPPTHYDRFEPREVVAAAPDFLARAFGNALPPGRVPHPLAANIDLPTIMHAFGRMNQRPGRGVENITQLVMSQGVASNGFVQLIKAATVPVVMRAYQAAGQQRPFAGVLPMVDFRPQPIYGYDIAHALDRVLEGAKISRRRAFYPDAAHGNAMLGTYSQIFELTRSDFLNSDLASLVNILIGAGTLAAQKEMALLAEVIESGEGLSDGNVYDATNTVAQSLSDAALATAVGMLRNQGAPGRPLNIAPAHVVVHPDLELPARKLVKDADLRDSVQVTALPGLADGRWLVFGSPERMPCLALYQLEGKTLSYGVHRSFATDGIDLAVSIDAGAGFVGRVGVVKGGS